MPAYNAAKTLKQTYDDIPLDVVDDIVLVDDASADNTIFIAQELGIKHIIKHERNKGYGASQKTCYEKALSLGGDIIIMLHPDYQYNPKIIPSISFLIANEVFDVVLGSRILAGNAIKNGMPCYKYFSNRILTFLQNLLLSQKLSEYHTGYRAYSKKVLERINYKKNSDDFIFDNQLLAQIIYKDFTIGEISCPAKYFPEASSINFPRSIKYGLGVLITSFKYRLNKFGLAKSKLLK